LKAWDKPTAVEYDDHALNTHGGTDKLQMISV
jgi:hypothetical protein